MFSSGSLRFLCDAQSPRVIYIDRRSAPFIPNANELAPIPRWQSWHERSRIAPTCGSPSQNNETLHEKRTLSLPFLAQECASPPAFAVKALHFASMNANYAALTARAAKRQGPPRRAFASFFQAEITPEKRKKEGNQMPERQYATWGELLREAILHHGN